MRQAMASAPVGDDVYGDDPTVKQLESAVATLLGKEDAVYVPSGTMCNQIAVRTHTEHGDTILLDELAHIYRIEGASTVALSGVVPRLLPGVRGIFTAADVLAALPISHPFFPSTVTSPVKLLCVENTHNFAGGSVWPIEAIQSVTTAAHSRGLATHLDGARLWHASIASGISEAEYAQHFDTVSVCFSKGLGAPVGSCLAGSATLIARARRFKQQFGGGFRQAGIIAAGALYALEHHRPLLHQTHSAARRFAEALAQIPGISVDPATVESNIVRFDLTACGPIPFVEEAHRRGLFMLPFGPAAIRAVFYLDITPAEAEAALNIIRETLASLPM
jgi:threonine aldolase